MFSLKTKFAAFGAAIALLLLLAGGLAAATLLQNAGLGQKTSFVAWLVLITSGLAIIGTAWFAFLHDSQRVNDGRDPWHGRRAADFAVKLRREGVLDELDAPSFEHLCEAMRLHSDGHTTGEPAIVACWDADRLDLGRVGISPDPSRLCTRHAMDAAIIELAHRLSIGERSTARP